MLSDECSSEGYVSRATANKITVVFTAAANKFDGTYTNPRWPGQKHNEKIARVVEPVASRGWAQIPFAINRPKD